MYKFDKDITEVYSQESNSSNFSDNGLVPARRQAIIWTNDVLCWWLIYASLYLNELTIRDKLFYLTLFTMVQGVVIKLLHIDIGRDLFSSEWYHRLYTFIHGGNNPFYSDFSYISLWACHEYKLAQMCISLSRLNKWLSRLNKWLTRKYI